MTPQPKPNERAMRRQSGVTLVEVLVSMVIMALGLVSLAALQNYTLRYQLGSVHRAQLSGLLSDYAERVRSNLSQAPGVAPVKPEDAPYAYLKTWEDQASVPDEDLASVACTGESVCAADALANADKDQWRARVRRELPRGSVWVEGDAVQGMTVTFMWADKENVDSAAAGNPVQAASCKAGDTGLAQQTCCPANAKVPAGVRCATFSLIP